MQPLIVTHSVRVPIPAMTWHAVRASGPGGQNVNKVSSKVELRVNIAAVEGLSPPQRARLLRSIAASMTADGSWVITSQRTRSQVQNLEDAREKVRAVIQSILPPPKPRKKTRPSRAARQRRLTEKRQRSEKKADRRWKPGT